MLKQTGRSYLSPVSRVLTCRTRPRLARDVMSKIIVVVGKVTDNVQLPVILNMTIYALQLSERERAQVLGAGGGFLKFEYLALRRPTGTDILLLRGPRNRDLIDHFGHTTSVNNPHSHAGVKTYVRSNGRRLERSRGSSQSCKSVL